MRRRAAALALGLLVLCGCMVGSLQQSEADAADEPETAAPPAEAAEASSAERAAPSAAAKAATAQSSAGAKAEEAAAPAAAAAGEQAPKAKQQPAVSKGTSQAASQAKGDAAAAPAPAPAAKAAPKPKPAAKPTPAAVPAAAEGGQPPSKGAEAAPGPEQVAAPEPQPERVAAAEDQPAPAAGEEEEQPKRQGPKLLPKKVQVVAAAPEAEVENDDDIDPQGDCADFIPSSSCKDVDFGDGRVAECLSQIIAAAEAADTEAEGESVPIACASELATFFIKRSKNINANVPLARACKADAERLCNNTYLFGGKTEGQVISCLKDSKDRVSPGCRAQLFRMQLAAANDYRADPALNASCSADEEKLCKGVKAGGGRKQACLRDNYLKLDWECAEQLFRQELDAEDDIRLSVRLFQRCLGDKKRSCPDVEPGHAEAKDCLIEHRNDAGFSAACRDELDAMIERRVRDFRLDSRLRRYCQADILAVCGMMDGVGDELDISWCLQDYVNEIKSDQCRALVRQYQALAAQDVRFDAALADACFADRQKLCKAVPPGSARVIRCLESHRDALAATCRATLFDSEVRFSENIDFQFPMKQACATEMGLYCAKLPHGNARVIRCLQEHKGRKDFGRACLKEVLSYEQRASSDYRLNHRLRTACRADVEALCKGACSKDQDEVCGGTVLRCLTEKQDELKSDSCRREVVYFMKMQVQDYHNDVILAAACRNDVERFCKDVKPGEVHACLRAKRADLSDGCRREQMILEQAEAETIELRPNLLRSCANERQLFCKDVRPGNARVFRCLAEKLADPDFGPVCRGEVLTKLQRRQANWRLDPPLRKACRADVAQICKSEDDLTSENGVVYKCLVSNHDDLDPGCRRELGRALHMAFVIWHPGGVVTSACDVDIAEVCLKERPNMLHQPGQIADCLADALERIAAAEAAAKDGRAPPANPAPRLSDECRALADVAAPPDMRRAFEESLSAALLTSRLGLSAIESKTGVSLVARDAQTGEPRGVTLTGWTALFGVAAAVVTLLGAGFYGWRHYHGIGDASTVVLKSRQGYRRVSTS